MVSPEASSQEREAAPATVYYSDALFTVTTPDNFRQSFNSSRFDYGYGPGPHDKLTSVHT